MSGMFFFIFSTLSTPQITMTSMTGMFLLIFVSLSTHLRMISTADTSVTNILMSAPVNPVDEKGMLSLHCQVSNIEPGQTVTLSRRIHNGPVKRITWGKDILSGIFEDRAFLAIRQLQDGSTVYFLSIIDINRDDAGTYTCAAVTDDLQEITSESVDITVYYFPSDIYPVCSPSEPPVVYQGVPFRVGCSSEAAFPSVLLTWSRTGTRDVPPLEKREVNGMINAEIEIVPTLNDQDALFLCEATSKAFPSHAPYTCHIGPLTVVPNDDYDDYLDRIEMSYPLNSPDAILDNNNARTVASGEVLSNDIVVPVQRSCQESCSLINAPVFYWMLATGVACFLGILFMILGIILYIKMRNTRDRKYVDPRYLSRDIYVELDQKMDENQLYMSLDKAMQRTISPTGTCIMEPDSCYNTTLKPMIPIEFESNKM